MLNTASELKDTVNFAVDFSKTGYSNFLVTFFLCESVNIHCIDLKKFKDVISVHHLNFSV